VASRAARAWYEALRTLEQRAARRRADTGRVYSRRAAANALKHPPYKITLTSQRISSWLPDDPEQARIPQFTNPAIEQAVWALIRLWSDWAGESGPDRGYWMGLLEAAQPSRNRVRVVHHDGPHNLPLHTSRLFVGRGPELECLDRAFAVKSSVVVHALHGLGGVGKSTLAAHWAARHLAEHAATWWITADSSANLDAGLARLSVALDPDQAGRPMEALTERAVQWLAGRDDWLLILDNVITPRDVELLVARIGDGRLLITSRLGTGWHRIVSTLIKLDMLEPAESLDLLSRIAGPGANSTGGPALCAALGHLPLAIEQAAAYLGQTGTTPDAYLSLLQSYPGEMFAQAAEGTDPERTIARIWRVTLDRLADTPAAGDLLRILAWYSAEAIPRTVLGALDTEPAVQHAIGRLAAYALISADPENLTVHRLVQAVARTPDAADPHRQADDIDKARHRAARLLHDSTPRHDDVPSWSLWNGLLPHITALTERTAAVGSDTVTTAHLLIHTAHYLGHQGQTQRAQTYYQRAYEVCLRDLGAEHSLTTRARFNMAQALRDLGDSTQAIALQAEVLANSGRVLGFDHIQTLEARNDLAYTYVSAGNLDRAVELFKLNVAEVERIMGPASREAAWALHNLAYALQAAGDLRSAISFYEQALEIRQESPEALETLTTRINLASAYRDNGETRRARDIGTAVLKDCERVLARVSNDHAPRQGVLPGRDVFTGLLAPMT
jgi:tetratricopeptide (TPR) repeat protein